MRKTSLGCLLAADQRRAVLLVRLSPHATSSRAMYRLYRRKRRVVCRLTNSKERNPARHKKKLTDYARVAETPDVAATDPRPLIRVHYELL